MSWFTRLFPRRPGLVGQRVHAWHYTPFGRARVEGEVMEDYEDSLVLDPSRPVAQEFRPFVTVWRHDARQLSQALPEDGWLGEEKGT